MFFFFSSRRRHTRCLSDWSSDVCSSDLYETSALGLRYVISQVARDEVVVDVTVLEGEPSSLLVEDLPVHKLIEEPRKRQGNVMYALIFLMGRCDFFEARIAPSVEEEPMGQEGKVGGPNIEALPILAR